MQPASQSALTLFLQQPLADRLDLLLARRDQLFEQEQRLLARQAELEQQRQQWLTRRTVHALHCRLFWLQLRYPRPSSTSETKPPPFRSKRRHVCTGPMGATRATSLVVFTPNTSGVRC